MKKLLLILLLAVSLMSFQCEADEPTTQCDCYTQTWVRWQNNEWYHNGNSVFYSNDCEDDGKEVGQPYSGQGYSYKYIVNCE